MLTTSRMGQRQSGPRIKSKSFADCPRLQWRFALRHEAEPEAIGLIRLYRQVPLRPILQNGVFSLLNFVFTFYSLRKCRRFRSCKSTRLQQSSTGASAEPQTVQYQSITINKNSTDSNKVWNLVRDQGVGGSNPLSPTNIFKHLNCTS